MLGQQSKMCMLVVMKIEDFPALYCTKVKNVAVQCTKIEHYSDMYFDRITAFKAPELLLRDPEGLVRDTWLP